MQHFTERGILDPGHAVLVHLAGAGGTGSIVLNELGRMDFALRGLGHPGLHLIVYDPDDVSEANLGRQLFSPVDLGQNKAKVLVERVNRFFGLSWESRPEAYLAPEHEDSPKILITAVDSASARLKIKASFEEFRDDHHPCYWLDLGNRQKDGQAILGTLREIEQPETESSIPRLATVLEAFPDLAKEDVEQNQGPSCSLGEALSRQDLFVNRAVATFGCTILWKLFREARISVCGAFVNLESFRVNPLTVEQSAMYCKAVDALKAA